jgi:hypothetical protein
MGLMQIKDTTQLLDSFDIYPSPAHFAHAQERPLPQRER